jgi:hypothetical protein
VEYQPVVETTLSELDEVGRGDGRFVLVELELDGALAGPKYGNAIGNSGE